MDPWIPGSPADDDDCLAFDLSSLREALPTLGPDLHPSPSKLDSTLGNAVNLAVGSKRDARGLAVYREPARVKLSGRSIPLGTINVRYGLGLFRFRASRRFVRLTIIHTARAARRDLAAHLRDACVPSSTAQIHSDRLRPHWVRHTLHSCIRSRTRLPSLDSGESGRHRGRTDKFAAWSIGILPYRPLRFVSRCTTGRLVRRASSLRSQPKHSTCLPS